jgi:hypothetical protein
MNKEFIPYQQALELKELGFNEPCFGKFYFNHLEIGGNWSNDDFKEDPDVFISAPLYQQAFRWFREKYGIHITPKKFDTTTWIADWGYWESPVYYSYEEAELACLIKLIESLTDLVETIKNLKK